MSATDDRIAAIEAADERDVHRRLQEVRRERDGAVAERDCLTREVERLTAALTLAHDALAYAVEDHHLHEPECLCPATLVTLRAARDSSREALREATEASE